MNEFGAKFYGYGTERITHRKDASSYSIASFKAYNIEPGSSQLTESCETCDACADHDCIQVWRAHIVSVAGNM